MGSQETAKIKYILVCDDMREEKDTGKFTLLGLYSGMIMVNAFPALLPKIAFRICLAPLKFGDTISMELIRPDSQLIGSGQIRIEAVADRSGEGFVNFILAPFPVELPGEYKLVLKQGEKKSAAVAFEADLKQAKKH